VSAATFLAVLRSIEQLYESVVGDPGSWHEQAFVDWAADTLADANELPREAQREVRRSLRAAQKLQAFWSDDQSAVSDYGDWQSKVDIALGARAWRPLLDLARVGLDTAPSEELFDQVKERFALVNSDRWMDGVSFEQWCEDN
jgi:hypothetical protein